MDAATVRWDHVDWKKRTLHRPNPKGGTERAFSIPLATECVRILKRRRAGNVEDNGWVFPTDALGARKRTDRECDQCLALGLPSIHAAGARVHIIEPFEPDPRIVSPHRLRDTYTSALAALDPPISGYAIDVLTNHRPPRGTVTAGYIDLSADDLRAAQERVSKFLLAKCAPKKRRREGSRAERGAVGKNRPRVAVSREKLYEEVWAEPMVKVADRYDVSSSFLARICTRLNVPRPSRGYWAQLEVGKAEEKPRLADARPGDEIEWSREGPARRLPRERSSSL
jgi:hypothetical protein